ncbi:MAG: hypothetical protein A2W03_02635 [Candidatus Aminicenantes bacterium RBG_16_63_16]|nr:MAG: hypothetical protein A2W03_02635 [Candidatus Aminicenantes bacterium RBG_16_63_16]
MLGSIEERVDSQRKECAMRRTFSIVLVIGLAAALAGLAQQPPATSYSDSRAIPAADGPAHDTWY